MIKATRYSGGEACAACPRRAVISRPGMASRARSSGCRSRLHQRLSGGPGPMLARMELTEPGSRSSWKSSIGAAFSRGFAEVPVVLASASGPRVQLLVLARGCSGVISGIRCCLLRRATERDPRADR